MFDRLFFPALVFAVLASVTAAFAIDLIHGPVTSSQAHVVQLERVVIVARREAKAPALRANAVATSAQARATALR